MSTITQTATQYLSTRTAAERSEHHVATIQQAIATGQLRAFRPGGTGQWRIADSDLDRWVKGLPPLDDEGTVAATAATRRPGRSALQRRAA